MQGPGAPGPPQFWLDVGETKAAVTPAKTPDSSKKLLMVVNEVKIDGSVNSIFPLTPAVML
jgi:hypothetical protein